MVVLDVDLFRFDRGGFRLGLDLLSEFFSLGSGFFFLLKLFLGMFLRLLIILFL